MASERDPIPCPVCREVIIGPLSAAVHLSDMHGLSMYGALARLTRELDRLTAAWKQKHAEQVRDRDEAEHWFKRVQRLTRELEEAREIICDLADDEDAGLVWLGKRLACAYCDADGLYSVAHADDCPIVRGRRALGPRKERRSEGESKGTVGPLLRGGRRKGDAR